MVIEEEGQDLVCSECGDYLGIQVFRYTVNQPMCKTCQDPDEPCPECGISPSEDLIIHFICKKCQIEKDIILNGSGRSR